MRPSNGGGMKTLKEKVLKDLGNNLDIISVDKIVSHPLVELIMKAARNEMRRIKINKGGADACNKFIPLDSGRTTRSILAEISQSY